MSRQLLEHKDENERLFLSIREAGSVCGWDVINWRRAINFWGAAESFELRDKTVLELGAGKGGLSAWFAAKGATVLCTDYPRLPDQAMKYHASKGCHQRIAYQALDARDIPFIDSFDIVVIKSVLGALPRTEQELVIRQIHKTLRQGGIFLCVENMAGSPFHLWCRRRFARYGKKWHYANMTELLNAYRMFETVNASTFGVTALFSPWEQGRVLLGIADSVIERIWPNKWKYIVSITAKK